MVVFGTTVMAGPRRWGEFARAAEESGFESVWVPEHLIMPVTMTGAPNTPHSGEPPISASTPAYDPWVQIATMAAQTTTVRLGTFVYNIGLRHPFITARSLTTLDSVSSGRIEFGIGASWLSQEWQAMELPFETRGRRVDETIRVIQRLFSEFTRSVDCLLGHTVALIVPVTRPSALLGHAGAPFVVVSSIQRQRSRRRSSSVQAATVTPPA